MLNAPTQCGEILNYASGKINYQSASRETPRYHGVFSAPNLNKIPKIKNSYGK